MQKSIIGICLTSLAVLMLFLSSVAYAQLASKPALSQVKWDYKVVYINELIENAGDVTSVTSSLENSLSELGNEGWELSLEIRGGVVMKRPR